MRAGGAVVLALAAVLVAFAIGSREEAPPPATEAVDGFEEPQPAEEDDAPSTPAERGVTDAREAIAAGRPSLLFWGLPDMEMDWIDAETGLLWDNTGCEVDDELIAYVEAYNGAMRDALAEGRLDRLTLSHKRTDYTTVAKRIARGEGVTLRVGDGPTATAGNQYRVQLLVDEDYPDEYRIVRVTETEAGRSYVVPCLVEGDEVPILFDHEGTTLVMRNEVEDTYVTFDLERRSLLQTLEAPLVDELTDED